jgi:hypothetical protein
VGKDDWREYQEDVADFFRSLGYDAQVGEIIRGVRSDHAIDVVIRFYKWGMPHLWIAECKRHQRPVTKADVETFKTIVNEIGAERGFFVSESGFQAGAFDAATKTNVTLTSLDELRTMSRPDLMLEIVRQLERDSLRLPDELNEFTYVVKRGPNSLTSQTKPGVDGEAYSAEYGKLAMLLMAFDKIRLGQFPIILPMIANDKPKSYVRVQSIAEFVSEGTRLYKAIRDWASKQQPRDIKLED